MKKTTYAITALLIAIFMFVVIYVPITDHRTVSLTMGELYPYPIDYTEEIDEINLSVPNDASPFAKLFNGLEIEISDSLERPILLVDSIYRQFINVDTEENRMLLSVHPSEMEEPQNIREIIVNANSSLKIMLPEWTLKKITTTHAKLSVSGLDSDHLQIYCNDHLIMTDCHIDSAFFTLGGYAKCMLKDSEINFMQLDMEDNFIKIDCCDSSAVIHKLDFKPLKNVKTDVYLNPANIDTLIWNRNDSAQLTIRTKHPITLIK